MLSPPGFSPGEKNYNLDFPRAEPRGREYIDIENKDRNEKLRKRQ